jgi:hypothetical protein
MTTLEMQFGRAPFQYPHPIETEVNHLAALFASTPALAAYPPRWLAIHAFEGDEVLVRDIRMRGGPALSAALDASLERFARDLRR